MMEAAAGVCITRSLLKADCLGLVHCVTAVSNRYVVLCEGWPLAARGKLRSVGTSFIYHTRRACADAERKPLSIFLKAQYAQLSSSHDMAVEVPCTTSWHCADQRLGVVGTEFCSGNPLRATFES